MTVRVKISHMDTESPWALVVSNSFAMESDLIQLIRPGGSFEFLIHSAKDLRVREITNEGNQKSGEAD